MGGYDPSRHHRRSIRLRDYDYSQCGLYFVTVCIYRREWLLGRVRDGVFYPSAAGSVVQRGLETLSLQYPGIAIECWVVMPNHIHFILEIKQRSRNPVSQNPIAIGEFIRQLKYDTTKQINQLRNTPGVKVWQRNYYERIIWDDRAHRTIANYIHQNPKRWTMDTFR
jgi:putative transposase